VLRPHGYDQTPAGRQLLDQRGGHVGCRGARWARPGECASVLIDQTGRAG
jgi:hypothetical protein